MKIEIYSTPTCHYCKILKYYLDKKGLEYTEYNVLENEQKKKEMLELTNVRSVPVIVINGVYNIGFNPEWIEEQIKC